ncbi:MAG TPA: hypothetical protein VKA84_00175, partial [Gemmatimonadaceae bacterium]|nr:hypothetical protein [Gemmatimonadaceae bacterium]
MNRPYRRTLFDRLGPDAGAIVKVAALSGLIFLFALILSVGLFRDRFGLLVSVLAAAAATVAIAAVVVKVSSLAGAGFKSFIEPSGSSTPYTQQFSHQEAMAA